MATFYIGDKVVSTDDEDFAQTIAGNARIGGSIVAGNQYGVTGGIYNGDVIYGDEGLSQ
ncbi:hypothetical protein ABZ502_32735 [Streptomyces abikoensis]|uniref:hypothetical protein n=1 Tax=Streptomyces abikoensis TaxID=97398 RepID=UPI0033D68552